MKLLPTSAALALALAATPSWAGDALVAASGQGTIVTVNQIGQDAANQALRDGDGIIRVEKGARVETSGKMLTRDGQLCNYVYDTKTEELICAK